MNDPNLLVGFETSDDVAVYRISAETALVLTVDYFTPVVDDPYSFGAIAAANSLSDVYAKGVKPLVALNLIGFPRRTLSLDILAEILKGGSDKKWWRTGRAGSGPVLKDTGMDPDPP